MSTTPLVTLKIDGQALTVSQGSMIIEAADQAHIAIPRFCYHKKLSVAANCRMCLVDVANSRKPLPACATPVADGMEVFTRSPKAISYQKAVMEFLLINHPLDCPICDQGGECELQDVSMGYGSDTSAYNQAKRTVEDHDIGPLIQTDLTRCIQCTRCVRFGSEIAGLREMGMVGRGEHCEISTFMKGAVHSELSGNVIDLCPVGALTNKPFRYQARAWEMKQSPMISMHDCLGSNLSIHVRRGEAMRAVPRENESLNEVWLSDRDRYSVHALNQSNRAVKPLFKKEGQWVELSWENALSAIVQQLEQVKKEHGADKIAALASPSSSTESFYLLQKLMRGIGSHHLDFRYHMNDFSDRDALYHAPNSSFTLSEMNDLDLILVLGSDTRSELPLFHHRIRQAALNGAKVVWVNSVFFQSNLPQALEVLANPHQLTQGLVYLLKQLTQVKPFSPPFQDEINVLSPDDLAPSSAWEEVCDLLVSAQKVLLVTGEVFAAHPQFSAILDLTLSLKEALGAEILNLTPGANAAGAYYAGFLPYQGAAGKKLGVVGLNARAILDPQQAMKAFILLNMEPGLDSVYGCSANQALQSADLVIAFSPFVTEDLKAQAHFILPIAAPTENAGMYVNFLGMWQSWVGLSQLKGEARPVWKVLRVLANLLGLPGFDYENQEAILTELRAHLSHMKPEESTLRIPRSLSPTQSGLSRMGPLPIYATDILVRQALPLQNTEQMKSLNFVGLTQEQVKVLGLQANDQVEVRQGESTQVLPFQVMSLADHQVYLPRALPVSKSLGPAFGPVELFKVCCEES